MNVNGFRHGGNAQQLSAAVTHKSDTSMIPLGVYPAPGKSEAPPVCASGAPESRTLSKEEFQENPSTKRKPSPVERGTSEGETR